MISGAAVYVFRTGRDGIEWLLLQRGIWGPEFSGDNAWGSPGGTIESGEEASACAARELFEETGLELALTPTTLGPADLAIFLAEAPYDCAVTLSDEHDEYE